MMKTMPQGLKDLIERAGKDPNQALPPVEKWEPPFCGDLDIQIKRDGAWFYMGTEIKRMPLVKLFATVLRRDENQQYYLVTPVEKIGITVEDAAFIAVELYSEGEGEQQILTIRTNVGDVVRIGKENPLRFHIDEATEGLIPYVLVRGRLEAKLARSIMYQLVELTEETNGHVGLWSNGQYFSLEQ